MLVLNVIPSKEPFSKKQKGKVVELEKKKIGLEIALTYKRLDIRKRITHCLVYIYVDNRLRL